MMCGFVFDPVDLFLSDILILYYTIIYINGGSLQWPDVEQRDFLEACFYSAWFLQGFHFQNHNPGHDEGGS